MRTRKALSDSDQQIFSGRAVDPGLELPLCTAEATRRVRPCLAREALAPDAILLYVAAGGFEADFVKHARRAGPGVVAWGLEDLYAGS